jgi:hypothetical protein
LNRKRKYIITLCIVVIVLGFSLILASHSPSYLLFREQPKVADCIIPLLGKEYLERKKEAYQLISEGYSNVLLVPPRYRLVKVTEQMERVPIQVKEALSELSIDAYKVNPQYYWHENTHIELILAKEYMRAYGFDSAIIVSSPYHMRRVKLLAEYEFPEKEYAITCVPDRYEHIHDPWWADRKDLTWIIKEYAKITWFLIYQRFSELLTTVRHFIAQVQQS